MTGTKQEIDEDAMAAMLAGSDRYKILRRLSLEERCEAANHADTAASSQKGIAQNCGANDNDDALIAAVVDVETTGIRPDDRVIELAVRRLRFDAHGEITKIDGACCWREDPGAPLDAKITSLTGLTDADLAGHAIDESAAMALFRSSDVVIAHNAAFDRLFVERRLPGIAGLAWACTLREVDWLRRGFSGYALGWLLAQAGFFHDAHRAGGDVDAVVALLGHRNSAGETALKELVETASRANWRFRAIGAAYDVKDALKARGYRWDAASGVWSRDVAYTEREAETDWLAINVYAAQHRPKAAGPIVEAITWHTRHA